MGQKQDDFWRRVDHGEFALAIWGIMAVFATGVGIYLYLGYSAEQHEMERRMEMEADARRAAQDRMAAEFRAAEELRAAEASLQPVELTEAISKNLVKLSASGNGLESVDIKLESPSEKLLKISIVPGTVLEPSSRTTQNMVVLEERTVFVRKQEQLRVSTACANMNLKTPDKFDSFKICQNPAPEDLTKLVKHSEFRKQPFHIQQFAIWTITDNPKVFGYVAIGSFGMGRGPSESDLRTIKNLFDSADISTEKYEALK